MKTPPVLLVLAALSCVATDQAIVQRGPPSPQAAAATSAAWPTRAEQRRVRGAPADFEVVLEAGTGARLTRRQRHPFRYEERLLPGHIREWATYAPNLGFVVRLEIRASGESRLDHLRRRPTPRADAAPVRLSGMPSEVVLGRRCDWVDMMPGTEDAGRHECRTADGLPLKVRQIFRGSALEYVATRVSRRSLSIDEIMPPRPMMERAGEVVP